MFYARYCYRGLQRNLTPLPPRYSNVRDLLTLAMQNHSPVYLHLPPISFRRQEVRARSFADAFLACMPASRCTLLVALWFPSVATNSIGFDSHVPFWASIVSSPSQRQSHTDNRRSPFIVITVKLSSTSYSPLGLKATFTLKKTYLFTKY